MMSYALSLIIIVLVIVLCWLLKVCIQRSLMALGKYTRATWDQALSQWKTPGSDKIQDQTKEQWERTCCFFNLVKWGALSFFLAMFIILGIFSVLDILHIGTTHVDILGWDLK